MYVIHIYIYIFGFTLLFSLFLFDCTKIFFSISLNMHVTFRFIYSFASRFTLIQYLHESL